MRHLSLAGLFGAVALAACNDSIPLPSGPSKSLAAHFDTLSAQATAASQDNRAAALDLALHALADGGQPGSIKITTQQTVDTATYTTIVWSEASVVALTNSDSVTDSLIVLVGWRGTNADSILVIRAGHPGLAVNIQGELATLGLTTGLTQDSLASAALVTGGNTVTLADSGVVNSTFGAAGSLCQFITVSSVTNDSNAADAGCEYVLIDLGFSLLFSPSDVWSLAAGASPGVVILR
jgi:hypothetical protein